MISLSIVIVNWNSYRFLERCLQSIAETLSPAVYEVIVVDNASTDDSVSLIRSGFPAVRLIANDNNAGFARANNQGFAGSKGKYVLILNPDTVVLPQAIERLTGFLDQHPDFAAVGPKLVNADKTIQFECARNFPTLFTELFWITTLVRRFPKNKVVGRYLMSYWDHLSGREVDCLSGAGILIRREVLENINFFDEGFFMYGEDVDLCYRVRKSGRRIYYLPEAEIIHYGGGSSRLISARAAAHDRQALQRFFRKHYGVFTAASYRIMCFFLGLGMSLLSAVVVVIPFLENRLKTKSKKVLAESLAILRWSLYLYER